MTDKLKQIMEKVSGDELLKAELDAALQGIGAAEQIDAVIEFAKRKGIALKRADFTEKSEELNLEELESVTGGGDCSCYVAGDGWGTLLKCSCFEGGGGSEKLPGVSFHRCSCTDNGEGSSLFA